MTSASVKVEEEITGAINEGYMVLVGVTHEDTEEDVHYLADKLAHLRIFEDEKRENESFVIGCKRKRLSVSQFTLYGDTRKGRRPNFESKPDLRMPFTNVSIKPLEKKAYM
ncbi:D-aminoacyl-tRNA deacylase [Bacillus sp. SL00103]